MPTIKKPRFQLPDDPPAHTKNLAAAMTGKLKQSYGGWDFRHYEKSELEYVLGIKGATEPLLASNIKLRVQACTIMAMLFARLRRDSRFYPDRQFCFGSFLGPIITEYEPVIDILPFKTAVDKLIRQHGLNAVCAIELQSLTNYPQRGRGRSFLLNAHALLWTDDLAFGVNQAQVAMRSSNRLYSELGAPTVTLTPRSLDKGQLPYCGRYMLKPAPDGKRRCRDDDVPTRWVLKPVRNVRPSLLLRLAELQSHILLPDLVFGVSAGTDIRTEWRRQLAAWNAARCARSKHPLEHDVDVAALWHDLRKRRGNGSRLYRAPKVCW